MNNSQNIDNHMDINWLGEIYFCNHKKQIVEEENPWSYPQIPFEKF